jgi:hypothetical protein
MQIAEIGARIDKDLLNAGRIKPRLKNSSKTLITIQTLCGIILKEGMTCSEFENFHTDPVTVCKASRH